MAFRRRELARQASRGRSDYGRLEPPQTISGQLVVRHGRRLAREFLDKPKLNKFDDGFRNIGGAQSFVAAQRSVHAVPRCPSQPSDASKKPSLCCVVYLR